MLSPILLISIFIAVVAIVALTTAALYRNPPENTPDEIITEQFTDAVLTESEELREEENVDEDEKLPAKLAVIALLHAADGEPIEGQTRIQKLVFLMQEEWDEYSDEPYPFEKYEFEPESY